MPTPWPTGGGCRRPERGPGREAAATVAEGEATAADTADHTVAPDVPARPSLLAFAAATARPAPPLDSYALRLVATRKLYDQGTHRPGSPRLGRPGAGHRVHVNPSDFDRLGVAVGDRVSLRSRARRSSSRSSPTSACRRGAAALDVNQADVVVGDLIDVDHDVTDLRIEAARERRLRHRFALPGCPAMGWAGAVPDASATPPAS